jgi:hypothetical protein
VTKFLSYTSSIAHNNQIDIIFFLLNKYIFFFIIFKQDIVQNNTIETYLSDENNKHPSSNFPI